ncbi:tripartite tricarboxylate transporter substrate-binding protein [Roseomonas sp. NAR14]|uniref:Tripartite tricarboxylate transporter substrate-binding protein n=1 Tax=Roseomonas acroporae TaxID=2937791 RepID=A0A9X1YEH0_9PROT|nr:tripartite tricarboxylate transporter substrate-binding protein [Roseomonas acroporae]MCK8784891.1 tripartite tricarboxylate transporter substrate-binding protein [Roseomonas acroporae]
MRAGIAGIGRRSALLALGGAALAARAAGGAGEARAETARTGRAIVGFPPGGTIDSVTRLYAERLRASGAMQLVVDNRPGAGGRMALELLKPLPADGSAFIVTPASMLTIYPHLYTRTLRYDPLRDFTPVSPLCVFPFGLAVAKQHPARTLAEFVAWAKPSPSVDWASPVPGSMPHFIGTELARLAGLSLNHIPYRGSAPAASDLLSGTLQAVILPLGDLTSFHRSGDVRLLAVSSPERRPGLEVPTFAEAGFPALTHEEWYGALLPAGAPAPVVAALHGAIVAAVPEVTAALARIDLQPQPMAPEAFRQRIARETETWGPIVAASGFRPDE